MTIKNLGKLLPMRIGVDSVVACRLTSDDGSTVAYSGDIYALPGVQTLNINPNVSMETAYYDNGPAEVASTLGNIEVSFTKSSLNPKEQAFLLGKAYTSTGILCHSATDLPPWIAIGFRTLRSDGSYRYVWMLKGKFMEPADNNETKGESINFQADELVGRFVKLNKTFTVTDKTFSGSGTGTRKEQFWKTEADGTDTAATTAIGKWFDAPVQPDTQFN